MTRISRSERTLIYGTLAVLVLLNVVMLFGKAKPAYAQSDPSGPDIGGVLGPADTLVLEGDASKVELRSRGDRLVWGDDATQAAYSVAFVDIGTVLGKLMDAEDIRTEGDALANDLTATDQEFVRQLEALRARLQGMNPNGPDAQPLLQQGQALSQEHADWRQTAIARRGAQDADHLERAYRRLVAATKMVATRRDIDVVYRFVPTARAFEADNPDRALLAIRLRAALVYPAQLDITSDVLGELGLTEGP